MLRLPDDIVEKAGASHGAISTRELRALNMAPAMQRRRVEAGLIELPLRGVAVIKDLADRFTPVAALQLRYPDLVAERRTAAVIFGLDGFKGPGPVPLDLVDVRHVRPPAAAGVPPIRIHPIPAKAIVTYDGLRTTTPTWTIGELGAVPALDVDTIELALESALHLGLTTEGKLRRVTTTRTGPDWPGTAVLAEALSRRRPGDPPTESYAETRFLQLVVRPLELEDPERQVPVQVGGRRNPYRCDFVFRRSRPLDIEIDGKDAHATEFGRDHDYERDHHVRRVGFEIVRFGAWRIEHKPAEIRHRLLLELLAGT